MELAIKDDVKINLGDSSWILVRPSGTEPLLRIYFESDSKAHIKNIEKDLMKKINDII